MSQVRVTWHKPLDWKQSLAWSYEVLRELLSNVKFTNPIPMWVREHWDIETVTILLRWWTVNRMFTQFRWPSFVAPISFWQPHISPLPFQFPRGTQLPPGIFPGKLLQNISRTARMKCRHIICPPVETYLPFDPACFLKCDTNNLQCFVKKNTNDYYTGTRLCISTSIWTTRICVALFGSLTKMVANPMPSIMMKSSH